MFKAHGIAIVVLLVGLLPADALEVGDLAPDVSLKDIRYLPRTLDDFGEPNAYVLYITTNGCPVAQRYLPRVQKLQDTYRERGVQFLAINVGPEDTVRDMALQAIEYGVAFPYLKDITGDFVRAFDANRTAEAFLLDAGKVLRYRGRIDDQYRLSGVRPEATRNDLAVAIDAVLEGRDVEIAEIAVDGCAVTPSEPVKPIAGLTFSKDVAPILYESCVTCHRPNGGAPFSLIDYKDAKGFARMIAEVVEEERMPPWYAHPDFGDWMNARGLTPEEKTTLISWARTGAKPGPLSETPTPPEFSNAKWQNGTPDLIIEAEKEEVLPTDGYIPYRYVTLPYVFPADTYVQGIEILPQNKNVVHHANLLYVIDGESGFTFLSGKVPGAANAALRPGEAMMIRKGAKLIFQIHYVTTGKEERDRIAVGFRYATGKIERLVHNKFIEDTKFKIPAGDPGHAVRASWTVPEDITARSLFSHMHLRGKDMTFTAKYPDGESERLLVVPNYSFDWQIAYEYEPGTQKFPKGTKIDMLAHYDNSAFNAFNPDATKAVGYGPQTIHEMAIGVVYYTKDNERLDLEIDSTTGQAISATGD